MDEISRGKSVAVLFKPRIKVPTAFSNGKKPVYKFVIGCFPLVIGITAEPSVKLGIIPLFTEIEFVVAIGVKPDFRHSVALKEVELFFDSEKTFSYETDIARLTIIIVNPSREKRRLRPRDYMIGVRNESEYFYKMTHRYEIVFRLLFVSVRHKTEVCKIRIPIKEIFEKRIHARRGVRHGHFKP